jgi:DNA polymerase-3 subunit beta
MKLVCPQRDLDSNLSLASRAVPSRPTHPILTNVLIAADEESQQLSITGFDLKLGIRTNFAVQVEVGGELTLPARLLNDIVSRLPDGDITLECEGENVNVTLTSTSGQYYEVRRMGAEDYPELPAIDDSEAVYLPADALLEGLRGTLFAVGSDDSRQVLTGVHTVVNADTLEFAATDGHRLAVVQADLSQTNENEEEDTKTPQNLQDFEVTIPANALRELERAMGKRQGDEAIALYFDDAQVIFDLGRQRLTSRLLYGQYPAYRRLIPESFNVQLTLDRQQLLSALERIAVLAERKQNVVKFALDAEAQQLSLSVDAPDVGSGKESLPVQISGGDLEIAFNVKYVLESLRNLQSSEVTIQMNTPSSPVILTPLGGAKMTHLVMPVQIRN